MPSVIAKVLAMTAKSMPGIRRSGKTREQQRVGVERHAADRHAAASPPRIRRVPSTISSNPGHEEQPTRAVQQEESQRPPAVAERLAGAAGGSCGRPGAA